MTPPPPPQQHCLIPGRSTIGPTIKYLSFLSPEVFIAFGEVEGDLLGIVPAMILQFHFTRGKFLQGTHLYINFLNNGKITYEWMQMKFTYYEPLKVPVTKNRKHFSKLLK